MQEQVIHNTEKSLLGYSYRLTVLKGSIKPFAVEYLKDGDLFQVEFFKSRKSALNYFNQSRTTLKVICEKG